MLAGRRQTLLREKIQSFCFFLSMAISVWAVRTPHSPLGPDWLRTILSLLFYVLLAVESVLSLFSVDYKDLHISVILLAFWPVLYWAYIHIWAFEMESFAITSPIIAFVFSLQNDKVKSNVYKLFKKLIIITSFIGIICYVAYISNLKIPYTITDYYDGRPYQNYINYFDVSFLYVTSSSTRLCGIFNEPGWLGTTIGLILCFEKYDLKKLENWILVIAGLLTYSVAFVLILAAGFIIRNIREYKKWIPIVLFLCVFLFILPNIKTGNQRVDNLISRLEISSGGLKGNNRATGTINELFAQTIASSKRWFGYGDGYAEYYNSLREYNQVLTIKTEIINFGIVGTFVLYIMPLFLLINRNTRKGKPLAFILCFWISLYQRPWLYIISNYMLLLSTISYLQSNTRKEQDIFVNFGESNNSMLDEAIRTIIRGNV